MRIKLFNCEDLIAYMKFWHSNLIRIYNTIQQSSLNQNANDIFVQSNLIFEISSKRNSTMQKRVLCNIRAIKYSIANFWLHTNLWMFDIRIWSLNRIVFRLIMKFVNMNSEFELELRDEQTRNLEIFNSICLFWIN